MNSGPGGGDADGPFDPADAGGLDAGVQAPADAAAPCPPGWLEGGESCYFVAADSLAWADAQAACVGLGGYLVIVADEGENERVAALAPGLTTWWIGATDALLEDTWRWVDGSEASFDAWALFQPDNFFNEDCAVQSDSGSWNDVGCEQVRAYVCERARAE